MFKKLKVWLSNRKNLCRNYICKGCQFQASCVADGILKSDVSCVEDEEIVVKVEAI